MISTETFIKILSEKSITFTYKELMEILDSELEKDPEDMDKDLVERILEALDEATLWRLQLSAQEISA